MSQSTSKQNTKKTSSRQSTNKPDTSSKQSTIKAETTSKQSTIKQETTSKQNTKKVDDSKQSTKKMTREDVERTRVFEVKPQLTPKESRREEVRQIFNMFDKNGDNTVSVSEVESLLISIGRNPSKEEVKKLVEELDTDKSGTLSFDEFMRYMDKVYVVPEEQVNDIVDAFKIFDLDDNGYITASEFKNILCKFGGEFSPQEVDEIFNMVDLNHDGKLDYAEFIDLWKYH